ncbi:hypothetical protein MASR2M44_05520 [Bacteroidota bacterium]
MNENKAFQWIFASGLALFISLSFLTNGIGREADSITHYLISYYAPKHPYLFFDHWGKPFFTLLASPFAALGFSWIKVFNTLQTFLSIWLIWKIGLQYRLKRLWMLPILILVCPITWQVNFSGLTEPLFASVLTFSVYLILKNKASAGAILVSFLPFVRSEGLLILVVFGLYFLIRKDWKNLALLASGHIIMSLLGWPIQGELLWVFTKIPYAHLNPIYGKGTWDHFLIQFHFMHGPIPYALIILSIIFLIWYYRNKVIRELFMNPYFYLVYGTSLAFFAAHTLFWALGIFGSMGLTRVFFGILPLLSLMMLDGWNELLDWIQFRKSALKNWVGGTLFGIMLVFPFLDNPASFKLKRDLFLSNSAQGIKDELAPWLEANRNEAHLLASDISVCYFLNQDPFDSSSFSSPKLLMKFIQEKKQGILVWDNWFTEVEDDLAPSRIDSLVKTGHLKEEKNWVWKNENVNANYRIYRIQ